MPGRDRTKLITVLALGTLGTWLLTETPRPAGGLPLSVPSPRGGYNADLVQQNQSELMMRKAHVKFPVLKFSITQGTEKEPPRHESGMEKGRSRSREVAAVSRKGSPAKRKMVRVSDAPEKKSKVRTACP